MPRRFKHRNVGQLLARLDTPQHETTAAHVSSTNEFGGKDKPLAKDRKQRFHVFWSCDAPEKDNLAVHAHRFGEDAGIAIKWSPVPRIRRI